MRTLLTSFFDPLAQTVAAGEFRARWAHDGILNCPKADEAREDLLQVNTLFAGKVTGSDLWVGICRVNTVWWMAWSSGRDRRDSKVVICSIYLLTLASFHACLHLRSLPLFSLPALPRFRDIWRLRIGSPRRWLLFTLLDLIQNVVDFHFFGCRNRLHKWHVIRCIILRRVVEGARRVIHDVHLARVDIQGRADSKERRKWLVNYFWISTYSCCLTCYCADGAIANRPLFVFWALR